MVEGISFYEHLQIEFTREDLAAALHAAADWLKNEPKQIADVTVRRSDEFGFWIIRFYVES